jgi:XisH protein
MALDSCHEQVVSALRKAGWELGSQPFYVLVEDFAVFPDIQAQRIGDTGEEIIVVEVKCFADERSDLDELYRAIGQCLIYRSVLKLKPISAKLYLAIPDIVYYRLFNTPVVAMTIAELQIKILIVDIDQEEIVQWLD